MSIFQNLRTRSIKQKWDAVFERSGKFASAFVDTTELFKFAGAEKNVRLPGDRGLIEHHGSIDAVGKALRRELVSLGIMQDGPGAPKGNRNAIAANREKVTKKIVKKNDATILSRFSMEKFEAVPPPKKPYAAPKVVTLQSTTKLVDGKLSTSVAKTKAPKNAVEISRVFGSTVKMPLVGATNDAAALPPAKKRSHHKIEPKRSHHKKPEAPKKRSHHKKVA